MERRIVYGSVLAGMAVCTGAWLALRPLGEISTENQISPKDTNPLATPTPGEVNRHGETIVNGMTGAVFNVVTDPEGLGRQCVELENFSKTNMQDVVGAAVALGPDPGVYVDVQGGTVYAPDGTYIGGFNHSLLPGTDPEKPDINIFRTVSPGTIVCGD
jgi:hypothetical protein